MNHYSHILTSATEAAPVVTGPDLTKYDVLPTKSAKIRAMWADGVKKTLIAKHLNIRYQHVRNVILTPTKG